MIYIGLWESSLRIGFIPSNSDYDDIFRLSNVKAAIADSDHNLRYLSNEAIPLNKEDIIKLESGEIIRLDENRTVKASELKVGTLLFVEDRTAVNELNVSLKEAIERSQEENSLLEIENEIKAEKQAIDVRNKLYDSISNRTRKQIEAIERILTKSEFMDRDPKESIGRCAVLGAYVKRQANLAILTEQYGKLKAEELRFAIRESMENLRLSGITADISGIDVEAEYDGKLLIFFYEIFEAVIEAAVPEIKTLSCILLGTNGLRMEILMDTPSSLPDMEAFPCETFDLVIEVLHEEEGVYVRVRENKANAPGKDNDKSGVGI